MGKPGGSLRVMKSRSLAKWALEMAIRSMMGVTCSASDSGCCSHSHSVALNLPGHRCGHREPPAPHHRGLPPPGPGAHLCTLLDTSMGRPMLRASRSKWGSKYSSGVMAVGLAWLSVCVISVCGDGPHGGTARGQRGHGDPPPRAPHTHPVVGPHVLLGDAQEGLQRGLTACGVRMGAGEAPLPAAAPCPPQPLALPLLLPLCWSERCSVRVRVISSTLDAP